MKTKLQKMQGFTLIEILVVIGIIAVLAAIVIIAINPARQFAQARNTQRTSNVETILNAIGQRMADNKGVFAGLGVDGKTCPALPTIAVTTPNPITAIVTPALPVGATGKISIGVNNLDLSCLTPTYIPTLPFDPSNANASWTNSSTYDTEYYVIQDSSARVTVYAPTVESALSQINFIALTR